MEVLASAAPKPLVIWRAQLDLFDGEAIDHIMNVNPYYKPQLKRWVHPDIWMEISETRLLPEDRTHNSRPNNDAVVDYLRQRNNMCPLQGVLPRSYMQHPIAN